MHKITIDAQNDDYKAIHRDVISGYLKSYDSDRVTADYVFLSMFTTLSMQTSYRYLGSFDSRDDASKVYWDLRKEIVSALRGDISLEYELHIPNKAYITKIAMLNNVDKSVKRSVIKTIVNNI